MFIKNLLFAIGISMTTHALELPDFDQLWNYSMPAETEIKFKELLPAAKKSENLDYYLQLQTQIARTLGLQGKFDEAHKTLNEVQKTISVKTPIAEIRYYLERGRVFNSSKKPEQARPLFIKAYELSQNKKVDHLAVDAAHMVAIAESKSDQKMEWDLKALQIAEGSQDSNAQGWLGSLYNNIGWTYHNSGQFEEALKLFKKAVIFRERKKDPSALRIAKWCVARTYRSLNKFDEAFSIQRQLEKELEGIKESDGYVFEELGELYLATEKKDLSKKYFALAHKELSKDAWFKENETKRLQRIKELGEVK